MLEYRFIKDAKQHPFFIIDCPEGFEYRLSFEKDENLEGELNTGGTLETVRLYPESSTYKTKASTELRLTVFECLALYLETFPNNMLYFTPQVDDNKQEARIKVFQQWKKSYTLNILEFIEQPLIFEGFQIYLGFIFKKSRFSPEEIQQTLHSFANEENFKKSQSLN
jgi:hypothetical protein